LRSAFTARNLVPPPALLNAIDRMMPMLRFFRHGDGNFALFNGMGPTSTDLVTTVLAYDDARGAPLASAPHSGYQRLESASTLVLMDVGCPPPMAVSQEAHAGCLSFELSAKQNRIVVNCGLPLASREGWRQVARTTAAHSTVTLNDTSSCRFIEAGPVRRMLYGTPMIAGPRHVTVAREEQGGATVLRASHDGYADMFNVIHQRILMLTADGRRLEGEDSFTPAQGELIPANRDQFALRFHLHPAIKANRLSDGHGAMLATPNKEVWTFSAYGDRVEIEESVYLAGPDGPCSWSSTAGRATCRGCAGLLRRMPRRRPPRALRAAAAMMNRSCHCDDVALSFECLGRVLINAGIGRTSALGANRTCRDGGNDVNDPKRS
jgi:uncharacterized heparinase superfamily protein